MDDPGRIAVAGAGIAGLTSALQLARLGHDVDVYERATTLSEVGAGIQLSPNVGRLLSQLGLDAALDAHAVQPDSVQMRSGRDGRTIARVPLGDAALMRYGAPYRVIHRADLQRVLVDAVAASPRVTLTLGATILSASERDGGVTLELASGPRRAPLLVVADGVWSTLRAAVNGVTARATGQTAWRAVVDRPPSESEAPPTTDLWLALRVHVVRYPIAGGARSNLVVVMADPAAADPADRLNAETALPAAPLARLDPGLRRLLEAVPSWTRWPLYSVDPGARWTRGRIALVGDAAHAMLPFLAQGGAMAIEDAAELAATIGMHGPTEAALAAYERRRKPRVVAIWREAERLARIYHLPYPASLGRDLALAALGPARLLKRMDRIYGWRPPTPPA
ncbi:FAD-dependent monooxygenase [Amorphus sp. MBR-141]